MVKYDLVWVDFPYEENVDITKRRPALILDSNTISFLGSKITSSAPRTKYDYEIIDWADAGLLKPCWVRLNKKFKFSSEDIINTIGHLSERDIKGIVEILNSNTDKSLSENTNIDYRSINKELGTENGGYWLNDEVYVPEFDGQGRPYLPKEFWEDWDYEDNNYIDEKKLLDIVSNIKTIYIVDDASKVPAIYKSEDDLGIDLSEKLEDKINISDTVISSLLKALQRCDDIYVEPTPKNREFANIYDIKNKDYKNLFSQIKNSDFVKAIKSTYPKYEGDTLLVFHSNDIVLSEKKLTLDLYVKVDLNASDNNTVIAISFHELNKFESFQKEFDDIDNTGATEMDGIEKLDESLNEAYGYHYGYVKTTNTNHPLIYSVSIEGPYNNRDGDKYNIANLSLVCGWDYIDDWSDKMGWADAENFTEGVQSEQYVVYSDESVKSILEDEGYEECERPDIIYHYNVEKDRWELLKESINEDYISKKEDWGEPYTYDEVEFDLKQITDDFKDSEGNVRCHWQQENEFGKDILKKHYKSVKEMTTGTGEYTEYILMYSDPIKELDESLKSDGSSITEIDGRKIYLDEDDLARFEDNGKLIPNFNNKVKKLANQEVQVKQDLEESVSDDLKSVVTDIIDYLDSIDAEFPNTKFLVKSWADLRDGIEMGIDDLFEVADIMSDYLKDYQNSPFDKEKILYKKLIDTIYNYKNELEESFRDNALKLFFDKHKKVDYSDEERNLITKQYKDLLTANKSLLDKNIAVIQGA